MNMSVLQQSRVPATQLDDVRSYMFDIETKEILHIDRLGADDVARALEKIATVNSAWFWASDERVSIKLSDWRVKFMRDSAVVVNVGDYVLVADGNFLLLRYDEDGWYVPVAKGREITWDGTEEFFTPNDIRQLVKDAVKRILEPARWLL